MKRKKWIYMIVPALVLFTAMLYLLLTGEQDASRVREKVVRFHVVAASDEAEDQALKLKVRDGLFALIRQLFDGCADQEEALRVARDHRAELEAEAERILLENGRTDAVTLEIGSRYFPTRQYGGFSFPAGRYQAVSLRIGAAEGENFWCVLFPALCISPAVAGDSAEEEMVAVVGEDSAAFLKKSSGKQRIKFALVEWFEKITKNILK